MQGYHFLKQFHYYFDLKKFLYKLTAQLIYKCKGNNNKILAETVMDKLSFIFKYVQLIRVVSV